MSQVTLYINNDCFYTLDSGFAMLLAASQHHLFILAWNMLYPKLIRKSKITVELPGDFDPVLELENFTRR